MLIRRLGAGAMMLLLCVAGCNSGYEGLVPVVGTVTFEGSAPPAPGVVQFAPVESAGGRPKRTAIGQFAADGQFKVTSFKPGDGLYPGRYFVTVICNKKELDYSKKDPFRDASYIADGYEGKEVIVEEGSDEVTVDLDLPLKKS